jgi:DNA-binding MurR/RpiR family transcriptional regulator
VNISNVQGELVYAAALAKPQSCAIIISYSGETVILGRVINALKENHIPIIAITSVGDNTLVRNSDCILKMCTREKLYSKIANFTTDSAISYLLDVLYSCVFKLDYDKNLKYKIDIAKKIENSRYTTNEILKEKGEEYFY